MRGARLGGPAAHVQKSLARPSAALSKSADKQVRKQVRKVYSLVWDCGFKSGMNLSPGSPDGAMGLPGAAVTSPGREKSPARKRRRQKGVDRSEVIRRHLSAGAGTPLYT